MRNTRDSFTPGFDSGRCSGGGSEADTVIAASIVVPPLAWTILGGPRFEVCRVDTVAGGEPHGAGGQRKGIILKANSEGESIPPLSVRRRVAQRGGGQGGGGGNGGW